MSKLTATRNVTVTNPEGVHLRPAGLFAELAKQFEAKIEIIKDGDRFDGKSALSMLTLVAEQGTELCIEATGHDAHEALTALVGLVESDFTSSETADK